MALSDPAVAAGGLAAMMAASSAARSHKVPRETTSLTMPMRCAVYDSIFAALAGWEFENAGEGNPPLFSRPGTMDVTAAQSCLVEILAGLYAKNLGQDAPHVETSLLGASAFTQGEVLMDAHGQLTQTFHLNGDQTGFSPYHRIYQCADGAWIALAAHQPDQQQAVRAIWGGAETEFAVLARTRNAAAWLRVFEAAFVPADLVVLEDAMNRFFDDPLNRELGLISLLPQPVYGDVEQPGAYWDFGDKPIQFKRCCPHIGEHSDEILREIGFDDAEIAEFRAQKIIL